MARGAGNAAVVNDELRTDIARLLLGGMSPADVAKRVASRGIAGHLAESEVARAAKSPYLAGAAPLQAQLRKFGWCLENQQKLALQAGEVPRLLAPDPQDFFATFWCGNRPTVISGLFDHWPARQWDFAGLASRFGNAEVELQQQREREGDYEIAKDRHAARARLGDVIGRITATARSNDFYVTAYNSRHNARTLAGLMGDVGEMPGWLRPGAARDGFFWMGPAGTITPFHHDLTNNLLLQVVGHKRVRLVPPGATALMRNHLHCFSRWAGEPLPAGPGDATRPPVLVVDIAPGDALFLPVGWWHHVEGLSPHIGLSFTSFVWDNDFYSHYRSGADQPWA